MKQDITMIIPYRDPGELLMAGEKVEVGSISGKPLSVVVQAVMMDQP